MEIWLYSFSITLATLPPHLRQFPLKTRLFCSISPLKFVMVVSLEQWGHHTLFINCTCIWGGIVSHKIFASKVNSRLIIVPQIRYSFTAHKASTQRLHFSGGHSTYAIKQAESAKINSKNRRVLAIRCMSGPGYNLWFYLLAR